MLWAVALLLLALSHAESSSQPAVESWKVSAVPQEWIVSLNGYHNPADRERLVRRILHSLDGWREIPRDNEAYLLPSDFLLLRIEAHASDAVLRRLRRDALIRAVTPHQRVEGSLQGVKASVSRDDGHLEPIPIKLNAPSAWLDGATGANVKVAIFDTGLSRTAPYLNNVAERKDWTSEKTVDDAVGHGTFVAGMVAGTNPKCMGMAPDSILYVYRVFTTRRVSFTAWFLDAFNYAIHTKVDVLNLSIGGPDFMDRPFTDKVAEVTSSGIVMVSAIGNDGPLWGTLNNPADMMTVVGVGGLGRNPKHVALFSSRGMTTWEFPTGAGRVKPDVVTHSSQLYGADRSGGCMFQSGTSMASPVVAGAIAVLISSLPRDQRHLVNPGSVKQVLIESAVRLGKSSIFEQGSGHLNLPGAIRLLQSYSPRISFYPPLYDTADCPYFAPYCEQPLYHSAMPLILNATIINGVSVTGKIIGEPALFAINKAGHFLRVAFDWPAYVWPWSGYLGMRLTVAESGRDFDGTAEAVVRVSIMTPHRRVDTIELPLRIRIVPTPPRRKRLLWDQYHNARYPPGYFPRDDLLYQSSPFDWNGDSIYSNFLGLFRHVRKLGYFLEVLGEPWTCFDAKDYAAILVVDPEEEYWEEEQKKLELDIRKNGLSLIVLADWYHVDVMKALRFDDQNTRKEWTPVTGGAHLPALNDFLETFGIAFTTEVVRGPVSINGQQMEYSSGSTLGAFPAGAHLLVVDGLFNQKLEIADDQTPANTESHPIGGWFQLPGPEEEAGRIVVFGDSSFVDGAGRIPSKQERVALRGFWMLDDLLAFVVRGLRADQVLPRAASILTAPLNSMSDTNTPRRFHMASMLRYSKVLHAKQSGKVYTCLENLWVDKFNDTEYDWKAFTETQSKAAVLSAPVAIDGPILERILRPKVNSQNAWGFVNNGTLPWILFGVGIVILPAFVYIQLRRESYTVLGASNTNNGRDANAREKLGNSFGL